MVYIVGASSLKHAIENLPPREKRVVAKFVTAVSSLSLNPNTSPKRPLINLSHLLQRWYLRQKTNLAIWHDVINNSLTKHKSNSYTGLEGSQLASILLTYKERIAAIVYCQRFGAPQIFEALRSTNIVVIRVTKNLISRRRQQDNLLLHQYLQLNQEGSLEIRSLQLVLKYSTNLKALSQNTRRPRKRLSQKKRRFLLKKSSKTD